VSNEDIRNIIKITRDSTESDKINWIGLKEEEA
jgi:pyruvate ferredoxin oxidoreductase alpha subunit